MSGLRNVHRQLRGFCTVRQSGGCQRKVASFIRCSCLRGDMGLPLSHCQAKRNPLCRSMSTGFGFEHMISQKPEKHDFVDASDVDDRALFVQKHGEIHLILGPMFAGKTTALLDKVRASAKAGRNVALVKSDKDTRYGLEAVVSHTGMQMPCIAASSLQSFKADFSDTYSKVEVIGIDEAQFFKDLISFCQVAADLDGKILFIAGLDGDFLRRSFGSALELIPIADTVTKLSSRCEVCGKAAAFTLRKTDDRRKEVIGGGDVYMPVCRQHYVSGQIAMEAFSSASARNMLLANKIPPDALLDSL